MEEKYIFGFLIERVEHRGSTVYYKCHRDRDDVELMQVLNRLNAKCEELMQGESIQNNLYFSIEMSKNNFVFRIPRAEVEAIKSVYKEAWKEYQALKHLSTLGD